MIRATNVKRGRISAEGLIRIKRQAIPESRNAFLKAGDIIVVRSGAYTGDVAMVTKDWAGSVAGYDLVLSLGEQIDPAFCSFNILGDAVQTYFRSQSARSAQPHLNRHQLESTEIPLPPLPEQRKIARVLGMVQRAIEQQERLLALTAELKNALLHKLFTEGLRGEPQKQTEIGPVPESWEVVKMGSIGKVVTGSTPKTKVPEYYSPPEVDFIAPADLGRTRLVYDSEKKISIAGLQTIRRLPKDAVMCVCIGSSIGKVGMTAKEVSATNQQINSIVCGERHESAFVYYLLSYLCDYWRGFATFGPVPILSKGSFEAIKIAVPPTKEEESEISGSLCALDAKAEVHMRKHATLTALFRTLLHQLMTAQIRVHDLKLPELEATTA